MFNNLEPWLNTLTTILVILGSVMVLLLIVDISLVATFKAILSRHNKAMNVMLMTKYDNIKKILDVLSDAEFPIDPKMSEIFLSIDTKMFTYQDTPECKQARDKLTYLRSEVFYLSRKNPSLENNEKYMIAKNNISETDVVYRNTVAMYNADVLGYNYWVRFMPYRWIFLLFKIKVKEII
ncbi:MAG TPA: hypothetical protein PKO28_03465 [Bacilli bacterium]|nr:hypothetical protein [Bacilli bacterium]HPS18882.1 hypothetical protein [Bacilli bacterium]